MIYIPPMTDALGCPCCGDDGAVADERGEFRDEQPLVCGCPGHVCVEEDGDVWINNFDAPCARCGDKAND